MPSSTGASPHKAPATRRLTILDLGADVGLLGRRVTGAWFGSTPLPNLDAHGTGGARHLGLGRVDVVGIEIGHLDACDLGQLRVGDRADGFASGGRRALVDRGRLTEQ